MRQCNKMLYSMGQRIRKARKAAGLTQEKLAERIDVSHQYISDFERGLVGVAVPTVIKLSNALNVSTDYILLGENESEDLTEELVGRLSLLSHDEFDLVEKSIIILLEALNYNEE